MEQITELMTRLSERFAKLASANAVVGKPISMGDRHLIPLCELSLAVGGGGGSGEMASPNTSGPPQSGVGGGAGGAAKACPVAVLIIENGKVRLELLGE